MHDLIVLGGGPAGYLASERAAAKGFKVLLFEKRMLGGVCLNEGCVPTKTLLYTAKLKDGAAHGGSYGVAADNVRLDHAAVIARKDRVVAMLTGGVQAAVRAHGVQTVQAAAVIRGRVQDGYAVEAGGQIYEGRNLLIATGSVAALPPIPGLREQYEAGYVLTNREILAMTEVPESLAVIGGGVIGMEMASYFNSAGSRVNVVELLEQVGGPVDTDVARLLLRNYQRRGVAFRLGSKVTEIGSDSLVCEKDGAAERIQAAKVLCAVGRVPNTEGLGLESIGVQTQGRAVVTDARMQTNLPGVYAAGDVNGKSMLAHTAYREAEVAVNNMLGIEDEMEYSAIPAVLYTNPEIACAGETEQSARARGLDIAVKSVSMLYSGRYAAENDAGDGICKIIADNGSGKLIGVHMIANYASEIIWGVNALLVKGMTVDEIKRIVFPHPSVAEIIREAVFQL